MAGIWFTQLTLLLLLAFSSAVRSCSPSDLAALLHFKSALHESRNGIFNSWTGTDCCGNWLGVSCDRDSRRVAEISLRAGPVYTTFEKPYRPDYMSGYISPEICKLTHLSTLIISDWQGISGEIPRNRISGTLPADIGKLRYLSLLSAADNLITGEIPATLTSLTGLTHLDLRNNKISGPIPQNMGQLQMLSRVFLSGNQITGPIPGSICHIYRLVDLDLSNNHLSGPIPESLGRMAVLSTLKLDNNRLSGCIPGRLLGSGINELNLSHNMLEGIIPDAFGASCYFTLLDLSYNNLKGPIPKSMSSASYIGYVDFSHNHLCGPIPNSYSNTDASSFAYNDCLCGKPLKAC
ncbi:hypothetical protein V8G54_023760 [Vigna mungo]|uniref:Leucine-rich repeat-containing N-terminal plant-type domain-containing protein n=1 Tax=Vigna mungo TaxID=3915 RepID=A0AAQ3N4Q3_VIGMU